jgi:hypothetical protein
MKANLVVLTAVAWATQAALRAAEPVAERLRTDPLLMPYYTGRLLPTPQQVTYRDEYLPFARVAVVVGPGVDQPAPLVALLTERIARYGDRAHPADGWWRAPAQPRPCHRTPPTHAGRRLPAGPVARRGCRVQRIDGIGGWPPPPVLPPTSIGARIGLTVTACCLDTSLSPSVAVTVKV